MPEHITQSAPDRDKLTLQITHTTVITSLFMPKVTYFKNKLTDLICFLVKQVPVPPFFRLFQPCALNHESKKAIISIIAPQLAAMLAEVSTPSPHIHQAKVPLQFPLYHPPYQLECEPYKMQNEPSSVLGRENQVGPRIQEMTID